MATIAGKAGKYLPVLLFTSILTGCGLTQKLTDGTADLGKAVFYKQVKTLHLDIQAREGVNHNSSGIALSVVVRIYALKDKKAFASASYAMIAKNDQRALAGDILTQKDIRLQPGGSWSVNMPLKKDAEYIGLVAMFISPDTVRNNWRLVLSRDELDADKPQYIELKDQEISLIKDKK